MPVRPDWDPRGIKLFPFENPGDFVEYSNIGVYEGTDWFYCVATDRFIQQDPTFVCPDNPVTGDRNRYFNGMYTSYILHGPIFLIARTLLAVRTVFVFVCAVTACIASSLYYTSFLLPLSTGNL